MRKPSMLDRFKAAAGVSVRRSTNKKLGGRRIYLNQLNQPETSRTITVDAGKKGKKFVNVPSFNTKTGEDFKSAKQAKRVARRRGEMSKRFKSVGKAVKASIKESDKKGRKLRKKYGRV